MDRLVISKPNSKKRLRKADAASNEKERQHMADNSVTRFIHDLLTPLTSVRSLSEILHDYPDLSSKKRQEFLDIIVRETEKMTGMIRQVESPIPSTSEILTQAQFK